MRRTVTTLLFLSACGDPAVMTPPDAAPVDAPPEMPTRLSQTSLYRDFAGREIAPEHELFAPQYILWADAADKRRWIRLPPGASIDKSDPAAWQFPVGTQFFKEFSRGGVLLETRLIERTGPGEDDYWMGAFVWTDDGSEATYAPDGATDIRGTDHDAPSTTRCWTCHGGEPGRILGYTAVQLEGKAPGSGTVAAALGYLHANCGHCHSESGAARPDTDMILKLDGSAATPEETATYLTTMHVPTQYFRDPERMMRIVPGDPDASALTFRMSQRGDTRQMPPIATKHPDLDGVDLIRAWIEGL